MLYDDESLGGPDWEPIFLDGDEKRDYYAAQGGPRCECPGLADDPDCSRHGKRARR